MTDVRSMLRAERNARRVDHEDAHYTPGGMLMCKVCELPIKSDVLWAKHILSKPHKLQAQRKKESANPPLNNKKRKAADEEDGERKKSRAGDSRDLTDGRPDSGAAELNQFQAPTGTSDEQALQNNSSEANAYPAGQRAAAVSGPEPTSAPEQAQATSTSTSTENPQAGSVNEDEWAAFEREVATPPPEHIPVSALSATATIEAAPMSAEEIAARAREEANAQRGRRDEEVEAEKEDAARQLEEELDEMENYEERLRRLKEKREALRKGREKDQEPVAEDVPKHDAPKYEEDKEEGTDDEDDYDDEWDGWHMTVR